MKNLYYLPLLLIMASVLGCSGSSENSIQFKNLSAGDIYVNFRGSFITVAPGKTAEIKSVPKGTYAYSTTFEVPANTISSAAEGAVSGNVTLQPGTKILIVYSSTFVEGVYTIYATISSSDDVSGGEPTAP